METNKIRFNKGTEYGRRLIARSLQKLGAGRSVLCDKNDIILCGNDVYEEALKQGKKIRVIDTCANELVVVRRTDVDANTKTGKELALIDNLCQEKNLNWDADVILFEMNNDFSFDPRRWGGDSCLVKELDITSLFKDGVKIDKSDVKEVKPQTDIQQTYLFD